MSRYVGVDLGATHLRAAVADESGALRYVERRPTPQGPSGDAVTAAVLDAVRGVCASSSVSPSAVEAVGIGSIGPLDLADGAVADPVNLPEGVDRVPLVGPVRDLVGTERVSLHNDAVAGVIGERFYGDGTPDDAVYLTISSGIGAGVAVDGTVLTGRNGNAAEVGHFVVDPAGGRTCGCGRDGHWEAYCAGANVPEYARDLAAEREADTAMPIDADDFSARDVFAHAATDDLAAHVVARLADWNTIGVTNLVHAYAPSVVYVGGAVATNNPRLVLDPVRERLEETVLTDVPDLRLTTLGDDVVLAGAVAAALTDGTGDPSRLR